MGDRIPVTLIGFASLHSKPGLSAKVVLVLEKHIPLCCTDAGDWSVEGYRSEFGALREQCQGSRPLEGTSTQVSCLARNLDNCSNQTLTFALEFSADSIQPYPRVIGH